MAEAERSETEAEPGRFEALRNRLRLLYHGRTPGAIRFQFAVLVVDLAIIAFFIASPILQDQRLFLWLDYSVALLLVLDITARGLASTDIRRWLKQPTVLVDLFILVTLLAPLWLVNLGFLRILRLWTIARSGFLWRPLRKKGLHEWEDVGHAVVNLVTFLFVVTGFIYTFFVRDGTGIDGYVDALYFTVTSVTTTGYGDIILPGVWGRLTSIAIMIVGITLFFRLAQAIVRPYKVSFPCPQCALQRHDPDAVHCKACGHLLKIPDDGE
ncbi:ion transporter [Arsenicitalea aurantiaca]|uniref:Ion transporter n=1 Tax=Arsenicitalea aurantiaca TaxID=1783274 RepID=A0A433XM95_9HYPH|nr:potassium channel family protein [Arsenicitalea aurantiaca]RUT35202.1 ion transporter [Arsenicitalea aurantiaca]